MIVIVRMVLIGIIGRRGEAHHDPVSSHHVHGGCISCMHVHVCTAQVSVLYVFRTDTRAHVTAREVQELQHHARCNCNSTVSPTHVYLVLIHHGGQLFSPSCRLKMEIRGGSKEAWNIQYI